MCKAHFERPFYVTATALKIKGVFSLQPSQKQGFSLNRLCQLCSSSLNVFFLNLKFQNHNLKQGEEHWLGLDTMYYLTQERNYSLIVKMEDVNGIIEEVVYDTFIILNKVSSNTSINRW